MVILTVCAHLSVWLCADASDQRIDSLRCSFQREREREGERERKRLAVPGTCTPEGDGWREKWRRGEMEINGGSEDKGV